MQKVVQSDRNVNKDLRKMYAIFKDKRIDDDRLSEWIKKSVDLNV